ncbi:MAG TPA: PDZ domain-containing protein [Woeseiaceae bacterium]|nr:PDZ domain-containing protein [Woeseiaceae bacterium]
MQRKAIATIAFVATLGAAFAGARFIPGNDAGGRQDAGPAPTAGAEASSFDRSAPLAERIRALEQAVSDERYARQLLQEELIVLTEEIDALTADREAAVAAETSPTPAQTELASAGSRRRGRSVDTAARLLEAGFAAGQAEWIAQRESELQMETLRARYEAERTGELMDFYRSRTAASDALRAEVGDADYERYLEATARSTSVSVSSVLESSPAQRAGLKPGDQIVRYDGERIFSMSELTRATMQGQPGEQVPVDVLRDGVTMQMVLPRGPIGISGGRRFSP